MRVNGGNAGLIRGCDGAIVKTGDQDISRAVDIQRCKDPHQLTRQGIIGTDEKLRKRIHPFQLCQKPAVIPVEVIICNDTVGFIILQTTGKNGSAETKPAFEKTQTVKGGAALPVLFHQQNKARVWFSASCIPARYGTYRSLT